MKCEHRPVGEPAIPDGVGGFAWILDDCFSSGNRNTSEAADFGYHTNLLLRFRRR